MCIAVDVRVRKVLRRIMLRMMKTGMLKGGMGIRLESSSFSRKRDIYLLLNGWWCFRRDSLHSSSVVPREKACAVRDEG